MAIAKWGWAADEYAYWLAGRRIVDGLPIYDQAANAVTPTAFWYPPIVAQVIAPISAVVGWQVFAAGWIALMLGCLWWLAGRDVLIALALCAFPPVAVEFWWRNVHLILAVLLVLAIRRWGGWFAVAGRASRWRRPGCGLSGAAGDDGARPGSPSASGQGSWRSAWRSRPTPGASSSRSRWRAGPVTPRRSSCIPYWVRLVIAFALMVVASRLQRRWGDPLLVVAVVVGLPTLWFNALSTLVAVVPLLRQPVVETLVPWSLDVPCGSSPSSCGPERPP